MDARVSFSQVVLERLRFGAEQAISRHLVEEFAAPPCVDVVDWVGRDIAIRVQQEVLAQHLDRAVVRYPANWREAVKEALFRFFGEGPWPHAGHWPWFADYAAERWPVVYTTVQLDVKALYPKIAIPRERPVVTVLRQEWTTDE